MPADRSGCESHGNVYGFPGHSTWRAWRRPSRACAIPVARLSLLSYRIDHGDGRVPERIIPAPTPARPSERSIAPVGRVAVDHDGRYAAQPGLAMTALGLDLRE